MRLAPWLLILCLLLPARPARAQECRIDEDCAMPDGSVLYKRIDFSGAWRWSARAAARVDGYTVDGAEAQQSSAATASFDVAYASSLCRWIGIAGEVDAYRASDGRGIAGHQALTLCAPVPGLLPELTLWREHELRPWLGAIPSLGTSRAGRYGLSVGMHLFSGRVGEDSEVRVLPVEFSTSKLDQDVGGAAIADKDFRFDVTLVEAAGSFVGGARAAKLGRIDIHWSATEPADGGPDIASSLVAKLFFFDLLGYPGDNPNVFYDVGLGFLIADLSIADAPEDAPTLNEMWPTLTAGVRREDGDGESAGLGYAHRLETSSYSALVSEHRVSAWVRATGAAWSLAITGYGALTSVKEVTRTSDTLPTAGLGARFETVIAGHLGVTLEAEVARSFYAVLEGDVPRNPEWTGRLGLSLGFQADSDR